MASSTSDRLTERNNQFLFISLFFFICVMGAFVLNLQFLALQYYHLKVLHRHLLYVLLILSLLNYL